MNAFTIMYILIIKTLSFITAMIMSVLKEEFETFFHQADTDQDGFLTLEELTECLRLHGYKGTDDYIKVRE